MGFWFLLVRFEFRILVYVLAFAWCCLGFVAGLGLGVVTGVVICVWFDGCVSGATVSF